jgi:hypothetical protein
MQNFPQLLGKLIPLHEMSHYLKLTHYFETLAIQISQTEDGEGNSYKSLSILIIKPFHNILFSPHILA